MKKSILMDVTSTAGKTSSKTITDISTDASDGDILAFAQQMNALTTNSLESVSTVTKKTISGITYYDLALSLLKGEDDNNAITISGNTITVDMSEISGVGTDPDSGMTYADISAKINNTKIPMLNFNVTTSGDWGNLILFNINLTTNNITIGFKEYNNTINLSFTITIPEGVFNNQHYNAATVTVNLI